MKSGAVVEGFNVVEDGGASFGEGGEALVVDEFIFEAAPEGFDEGVVVAVAFAAHGSDQAILSKELPISRAGKLGAAIGVNDKGSCRPALEQRHSQSGNDKTCVEDLVHGPANNAPRVAIEDSDKVKPTLAGEDASSVSNPDVIGTADGEVLKAIGRDGTAVITVGGTRPILGTLPSEESLLAHEPGDAITSAGATQSLRQARTAVSLTTANELFLDARA